MSDEKHFEEGVEEDLEGADRQALPFCRAMLEQRAFILPAGALPLVAAFWRRCATHSVRMPRWARHLGLHTAALQHERSAAQRRGQAQELGGPASDACDTCSGSGYAILSQKCGLCPVCYGTGWRIR